MTAAMLTTDAPAADDAVSWAYDPWAERPAIAWSAALVALALCVLVLALRESVIVSLGLCLFCVGSFAPALSRVECRIDDQGVARRGWLGWERRTWDTLRRCERLPAGVLVSPYPKRHLLDGSRGMVLPMPAAQRDSLVARIEQRLSAAR